MFATSAACIAAGVARLVYTSTYNVVFGGVPISNGSELLPYYPAEKHVDKYSASKTVAEQLVLSANGAYLPEGSSGSYPQRQLATCAIRSAAIYGEGEERHFPRIVRSMNRLQSRGLARAAGAERYGFVFDRSVDQQWTDVNNGSVVPPSVVDLFIKSARLLGKKNNA
ncbi:hypothetical protein CYMTET_56790 [Cymbomonas tetramitiformis]|uniref:3-beta hydroxysteroid dehydrogenase/isomerase domain-containing protein n=1 Tax=Cymbomonas tetramitiformis TaxID=36881 RepID=A0AAE0BA66_9CHLO|nr:hypothetical protein CYMTET_56790 [Cymbomonas tetramitiformis]